MAALWFGNVLGFAQPEQCPGYPVMLGIILTSAL